jgi:hypothetical protein
VLVNGRLVGQIRSRPAHGSCDLTPVAEIRHALALARQPAFARGRFVPEQGARLLRIARHQLIVMRQKASNQLYIGDLEVYYPHLVRDRAYARTAMNEHGSVGYYEVAAQVMPLVLLALVVEYRYFQRAPLKSGALGIGLVYLVAFGLAEISALRAAKEGHADGFTDLLVSWVLYISVLLLVAVPLGDLINRLRLRGDQKGPTSTEPRHRKKPRHQQQKHIPATDDDYES